MNMNVKKHLKIVIIIIIMIFIGVLSIPMNRKTIDFTANLDNEGILNIVYVDGFLRIYNENKTSFIRTSIANIDTLEFKASIEDTKNLVKPKIKVTFKKWFIGLENVSEDEIETFIEDNYYEIENIKIYYGWEKIRFKSKMTV